MALPTTQLKFNQNSMIFQEIVQKLELEIDVKLLEEPEGCIENLVYLELKLESYQ